MRGGETNRNMLDSNISRGHGHQSSPSTLRRGDDTNMLAFKSETRKKKEKAHRPPLPAWGGANEASQGHKSTRWVRGHSLTTLLASTSHASTPHLTKDLTDCLQA
jgi:hypothetical protein